MQMNRCLACLVVSYKQIAPSFSMFKETSTNFLLRKAMLTSKEIIKALPLFSTTMFNIVIKLKKQKAPRKGSFWGAHRRIYMVRIENATGTQVCCK